MSSAFLHPFSPPSHAESDFINIVRAEGSTLWDDTGKTYIDGLASLWLCQIGHGRSEMVDAINAQMASLATYNTFAPFTNDAAADCAELIAEKSPFDGARFLKSMKCTFTRRSLKKRCAFRTPWSLFTPKI